VSIQLLENHAHLNGFIVIKEDSSGLNSTDFLRNPATEPRSALSGTTFLDKLQVDLQRGDNNSSSGQVLVNVSVTNFRGCTSKRFKRTKLSGFIWR